MKALVTGGAGFIGSHLVNYLVEKGFEVIVVDDLSMGKKSNIRYPNKVKLFVRDVQDEHFMGELLRREQFDYIYFLAAIASVADSIERPAETHLVNHTAVLTLLEYIRIHNLPIKQFLFTSSAAIYGNLPELPKHEESRVDPISPYAIDKYSTERFVLAYGKLYDLPTVCVRFFNVYGPGQNPNSPYSGVLSILTDCFIRNKTFNVFGDGTQTRDFIFVMDVIQAIWLITVQGEKHYVYNVANGMETSLNSIIQTYSKITKRSIDVKYNPERSGDVKHSVAEVKRLHEIGYKSRWTLQRGLNEYWEGVQNG